MDFLIGEDDFWVILHIRPYFYVFLEQIKLLVTLNEAFFCISGTSFFSD